MATVTKTYRSTNNRATFALTFSNAISNINVSGNTFRVDNMLPSVSAKISLTGMTHGTADIFYVEGLINNTNIGGSYGNYLSGDRISWSNNASKNLPVSGWDLTDQYTATYFNSSNKTQRVLPLTYRSTINTLEAESNDYLEYLYNTDISVSLSQTVTLDVPPTFNETLTYTDDFSGTLVAGFTTATITLSSLSAKYGGDFSGVGKAEFIIGSQSVSKSNPINGDVLSIALNSIGTFNPIVKITDSRGQVATHTLSEITVIGYNAPTVSFDASRTLSDGTPDDEGTYAFIEATFTFTDVLVDAVAPSVVVTDDDGTVTTPVVDWYTDAAMTTPVTWSSLSSGDTVYGIFSGLSTQHSYTVSIRPRDSEGTGTAVTQTIGAAFYTVDFLAGGHGVAFGKPASRVGFDCDMVPFFNTWIGIVQQFAGSTAPEGWLICDGSAVSRTDYAALFSVIGTTYGTGDGSTTFNIPNMGGRVPVGANSTYILGATGGNKDAIIPYHNHGFTQPTISAHAHKITDDSWNLTSNASSGFTRSNAGSGSAVTNVIRNTASNGAVNRGGNTTQNATPTASGGAVHYAGTDGNTNNANMQPYVVMNYIIYAGV